MNWLVIFEGSRYKTIGDNSLLNEMGIIMYLSMETGIEYKEILELPITIFHLMMEGVANVYKEKNRLQEESMRK